MIGLLPDPGLELDPVAGSPWIFTHPARWLRDPQLASSGWGCGRLPFEKSIPADPFPFVNLGRITSPKVTVMEGEEYLLEVKRRGPILGHMEIAAFVDPGDGIPFLLGQVGGAGDQVQIWQVGSFKAIGTQVQIDFWAWPPLVGNVDAAYLDDVMLARKQEVLEMRSSLPSFLDRLKAVIEAVDPNIGPVFLTKRRWASDGDLKRDGGALKIVAAGLFDDVGRIGKNAARFWMLDPVTEPSPLTNGSTQYRHDVTVTGFFSYVADDSQEEAIRTATLEILDRLNLKTTEQADLNTGDGYMGYLTDRPRMIGPIRDAELQDIHLKGHAVQLVVTYHEEISV